LHRIQLPCEFRPSSFPRVCTTNCSNGISVRFFVGRRSICHAKADRCEKGLFCQFFVQVAPSVDIPYKKPPVAAFIRSSCLFKLSPSFILSPLEQFRTRDPPAASFVRPVASGRSPRWEVPREAPRCGLMESTLLAVPEIDMMLTCDRSRRLWSAPRGNPGYLERKCLERRSRTRAALALEVMGTLTGKWLISEDTDSHRSAGTF
jgi:hypothetical protein